jgi:hypothetical protein
MASESIATPSAGIAAVAQAAPVNSSEAAEEEARFLARMKALDEGKEPLPPPAAHDEASATVARIAAMANARGGPVGDGQADDPETSAFLQRIQDLDKRHLAARAAARVSPC